MTEREDPNLEQLVARDSFVMVVDTLFETNPRTRQLEMEDLQNDSLSLLATSEIGDRYLISANTYRDPTSGEMLQRSVALKLLGDGDGAGEEALYYQRGGEPVYRVDAPHEEELERYRWIAEETAPGDPVRGLLASLAEDVSEGIDPHARWDIENQYANADLAEAFEVGRQPVRVDELTDVLRMLHTAIPIEDS